MIFYARLEGALKMSSEPVNVLYISYDGMTDPLGQSQVIPYLMHLAKNDYRFTLLSCEKKQRLMQHGQSIGELLASHGITWVPVAYTKYPPVLSTWYDLKKLKSTAARLHRETPFKIVHCRSYIPAMVGLGLKEKYGVKFIFDMRGFWADERVDGGLWNLRNPLFGMIYRFFKRMERRFLQSADQVISLTHAGKEELLKWDAAIPASSVSVIPCCADTELFDPEKVSEPEKAQWRQELGIAPNDFILTYLGSIGTWYLLDEMLDVFSDMLLEQPAARFLFISHDDPEPIRQAAAKKGIESDKILIKSAVRNEIPGLLSICHWSIFFIKPSFSKKSSSPTKQGELMAMGVPIICNAGVGDTDTIVEKYSSGIVLKSFTGKGLWQQIIDYSTNSHSIRDGALDYFSLEKGASAYIAVYRSVLN